jgi:hypothetical protein
MGKREGREEEKMGKRGGKEKEKMRKNSVICNPNEAVNGIRLKE